MLNIEISNLPLNYWMNCFVYKWQKIMKNAPHNLPEPNVTYSNCLFGPNPKSFSYYHMIQRKEAKTSK